MENEFSGPLPGSWASLTNLKALAVHGNQISGPLPPAWSSLKVRLEGGREAVLRLASPHPSSLEKNKQDDAPLTPVAAVVATASLPQSTTGLPPSLSLSGHCSLGSIASAAPYLPSGLC